MVGLPGAGKSTLASALAASFGLEIVDRDAIRRAISPGAAVTARSTRAATDDLLTQLREHLRNGRSTIVDGMTLSRELDRRCLRSVTESLGAKIIFVWVDCPQAAACGRVAEQSTHSATDRTPALVRRVAESFEIPEADTVRLDAEKAIETVREQALRALTRLLAD